MLGFVRVSVSPFDAQIGINDQRISLGTPVPLFPGPHRLTAMRDGYDSLNEEFTVAAGVTRDIQLTLNRVSASVTFSTRPAGAELFLREAAGGPWQSKGLTSKSATEASQTDTPSADVGSMTVGHLKAGAYIGEFRRPCHSAKQFSLQIHELRIIPSLPSFSSVSLAQSM